MCASRSAASIRGVIETAYRKPGEFWDYIRSEDRPWYLWQMLIPTGFMFIFEPSVILIAAPVLVWNILSTFGYQHLIAYHYVDADRSDPRDRHGLGHRTSEDREPPAHRGRARRVLVGLDDVPVGPVLAWGRNEEPGHWLPSNPVVAADRTRSARSSPTTRSCSAYHSIVPHIGHRERIYMWPVPWSAAYWGQLDQEGQTPAVRRRQSKYLVLPTQLLPDDQKIFDTIKDEFEVVKTNPGATLYKRIGTLSGVTRSSHETAIVEDGAKIGAGTKDLASRARSFGRGDRP